MTTIGERVRTIRKSDRVHMTLDEFGDKLGVRKTAISRIENGVNALTDQMKLAICREFGVNQEWLETGKGEMFAPDPQDDISNIVKKYHLADGMESVLRQMVALPEAAQEAVLDFIKKTAAELTEEAERERREREEAGGDDDGNDGRPAKTLSLEEVRRLPMDQRIDYLKSADPEELGLSNLVARKNKKD